MSLTIGLNTALSGLLTNQRGLDVIAQNVVNVNTVGYTRKVMNPESRVLAGRGAGVQEGSITRSVDEGMLKDIRRQNSTLAALDTEQEYYPRIEDLFGQVGDSTSIAHTLQSLANAFEVLATDADKPTQQWGTVQAGMDVTTQLAYMSDNLQKLRLEADRALELTVGLVNDQLDNISDLNQKIVRNIAIGAGSEDLRDKRDQALTTLAGYMDIQYYERQDGSMLVYAANGRTLVDSEPRSMSYTAATTTDASLSHAGGNFGDITLSGSTGDMTAAFEGGKIGALIAMRDTDIPNMQANLDEMAAKMRSLINQVHNRGTIMPAISSRFEGSRTFAKQGDVVASANDTGPTITFGGNTIKAALTNGAAGGFGDLTFGNADSSQPYLATITAQTADSLDGLAVGALFTISGSADSRNDGSYRVVANDGTDTITVQKANNRQTIQLGSGDDVVVALFNSDGVQEVQTTLRTIMQFDYASEWTSDDGRGIDDFEAKSSDGPWSVNEVSSHLEQWLKAQGSDYSAASVDLDSDGRLVIDLGTTSTSLAFRDQVSSTAGSDAADATINFDVDGDGTTDETVEGFSNFFGLNDFFVSDTANSVSDSNILASSFQTTSQRTFRILDTTGQIGNEVVVGPGSTLSDIAAAINSATGINESALLTSNSFATSTDTIITITDADGLTIDSKTFSAGAVTLEQMAGTLTTGTIKAQVARDGDGWRLRVFRDNGDPLTLTVSGGTSGSSDMNSILHMAQTERIRASVVPEGAGFRLRIANTEDREVFIAADQDAQETSIITDLKLHHAATRQASEIGVRADIQRAPQLISRGSVQWNADIGEYFMSEGDNSTALELADVMTSKTTMASAGSIAAGRFTFSEYASSTIAIVARDASHSKDQASFQTTLKQSLDFQYTSLTGVNLDEEVASMINFQQAYSASARVISVLQDMLEELVGLIR